MVPKALRTINKTRKKKARKRKSVEGDAGSLLFAFNVECACLKVVYTVKSIFAFLCLLKEKKVQESST
jgi:hypothetical protein